MSLYLSLPITLLLLPSLCFAAIPRLPPISLTNPPPQPHCADPPLPNPPLLADCDHVISHINRQVAETGNPLYTASRFFTSNVHCPIVYWDHLPQSTCAVRMDMRAGKEEGTEHVRLSDIAYAAGRVLGECLTPGVKGIRQKMTEGWMLVGRWGGLNVTVVRREVGKGGWGVGRGGEGEGVRWVEVV